MAKHLRITGLVQGVSYRASFEEQARALGLAGWVRNRHDSSVEAVVRGDDQAIERMLAWARRGPPAARVDDVSVSEVQDSEVGEPRFRVLPTA
jgi:acylphosphatase